MRRKENLGWETFSTRIVNKNEMEGIDESELQEIDTDKCNMRLYIEKVRAIPLLEDGEEFNEEDTKEAVNRLLFFKEDVFDQQKEHLYEDFQNARVYATVRDLYYSCNTKEVNCVCLEILASYVRVFVPLNEQKREQDVVEPFLNEAFFEKTKELMKDSDEDLSIAAGDVLLCLGNCESFFTYFNEEYWFQLLHDIEEMENESMTDIYDTWITKLVYIMSKRRCYPDDVTMHFFEIATTKMLVYKQCRIDMHEDIVNHCIQTIRYVLHNQNHGELVEGKPFLRYLTPEVVQCLASYVQHKTHVILEILQKLLAIGYGSDMIFTGTMYSTLMMCLRTYDMSVKDPDSVESDVEREACDMRMEVIRFMTYVVQESLAPMDEQVIDLMFKVADDGEFNEKCVSVNFLCEFVLRVPDTEAVAAEVYPRIIDLMHSCDDMESMMVLLDPISRLMVQDRGFVYQIWENEEDVVRLREIVDKANEECADGDDTELEEVCAIINRAMSEVAEELGL